MKQFTIEEFNLMYINTKALREQKYETMLDLEADKEMTKPISEYDSDNSTINNILKPNTEKLENIEKELNDTNESLIDYINTTQPNFNVYISAKDTSKNPGCGKIGYTIKIQVEQDSEITENFLEFIAGINEQKINHTEEKIVMNFKSDSEFYIKKNKADFQIVLSNFYYLLQPNHYERAIEALSELKSELKEKGLNLNLVYNKEN